MVKEKSGYWQCSHRLSDEVKDVRIAVLGHKIYYKWQTGNKNRSGYLEIKNGELMNTIKVSEDTIKKYVSKLEEIGLIKTKRINGAKLYKIDKVVARKYFKC